MPSLSDTLRTTASRRADTLALRFNDKSHSYRELAATVEKMAAVIAANGVRKGDRVLLLGSNSDVWVFAAYAVLRAGAILVPVNPASAPPEITYLIEDSSASLVLCLPSAAPLVAASIASSGSNTVSTLALGPGTEFADLMEQTAASTLEPLQEWPDEFDDALLLYTSGTTGRPKGALFDHHKILWVAVASMGGCGFKDGDRVLHVAPLFHAADLCIMLFPGVMLGATHIIQNGFNPALVADTLEKEQITSFFGPPTMYQFLLKVPDLASRDLSKWRLGLFGAAPMPAAVVSTLLEKLPQVELFQLCGQTEAGPGGIFSPMSDVVARPDASGRYALPNTECRIVSADGDDVEPGQVGELLLRSETVMKRYWNKPEETANTLRDGWLHTGDLVLLEADGYMTLVDRLKDMIITGGRNVYSVEVENALAGHPDIVEVAVLGVPHEDYGESILAVITPREGVEMDITELREWTKQQISAYKVPHYIVVHKIPRNASGKIQKHILRSELGVAKGSNPTGRTITQR